MLAGAARPCYQATFSQHCTPVRLHWRSNTYLWQTFQRKHAREPRVATMKAVDHSSFANVEQIRVQHSKFDISLPRCVAST